MKPPLHSMPSSACLSNAHASLSRPCCQGAQKLIVVLDRINRGATMLLGLLLAIATVSVSWQILVRMVLDALGINISAPWTEEVARYAMIWAVFIGAGVLCRHAALIAVEALPQFLSNPWGKIIKLLAVSITAVFFLFLAWVGSQFVLDGLIETSPVLRIPMISIYLALPLGASLSALNLLAFVWEVLVLDRPAMTVHANMD